jgi:malonyl-CoA O-methyltransferase
MKTAVDQFSKYAQSYDHFSRLQSMAFSQLDVSVSIEDPSVIFDVGCGTGQFTQQLASRFPTSQVIAFDPSVKMLEYATTTYSCVNIEFKPLNFSVNEPNLTADLIVSNSALHWSENLAEPFAWIQRHLSPGGQFLATFFGPKTFMELNECLNDVLEEARPIQAITFRDNIDVQNAASAFFTTAMCKRISTTVLWPSLIDLLRSIQYTGTSTVQRVNAGLWTPRMIDKLNARYQERYGCIKSTFDVIVLHAEP